jgi:hypothetical protein
MFWHLIALVFVGLGSAGIGFLLRTLSRKTLPKWIIPVCAGIGMLSYQVFNEYTWMEHKQTLLPADSVVIEVEQGTNFWRPWTYIYPMTQAFSLVDTANIDVIQTGEQRVARFVIYRFEKEYMDRLTHQAYLLNCNTGERIPVSESGELRLSGMQVFAPTTDLYRVVCP